MALPLIALGLAGLGLKNLNDKVQDDRSIGRQKKADDQALRDAGADVEPVIKEASGGMGPSAVMVGKQAYGTEGEAQAAADQQNTPQAKIQRQMGALIAQGRPDTALDLDEKAMKHRALGQKLNAAMKAEGISDFIDSNMVRAPRIEDVEAGKAGVFDFNPDDVKKFNAVGGKVTIGEGQKGRWTTFELPNGRKVVDFEVIDAEGKPVAPSARSIQFIAQMSAQSRDEIADKQFEQGLRLSIAQQGVDIQRDYKDGMLKVAQDRADTYENGYGKTGKGGAGRDKMSEVDKEEFDLHKSEAQKINENIMRAEADGTWEPSKNPSQLALLQRREIALRKAQGILDRYRSADASGSEKPKADPYGLRGKVGGSSGSAGPASQAGAPLPESGQGDGSDRFRIINAELKKAQEAMVSAAPGSDDWKRENANVESLKQEIGRLPMSERGQVARPPEGQPKVPGKPAQQPKVQKVADAPAPARQGPGILQQLGALIPDGEASTNEAAERQAEGLIRSGARAPLEALLKQNGSRLSEATKQRINKLLAEKV